MVRILNILLLLIILSTKVHGQEQTYYQQEIYQGYIQGDMQRWQKAMDGLEQLHAKQPTGRGLYNLLLARYGLTGYYLSMGERSKARELILAAENNIEQLKAYPSYKSRQLAMQGAFLGFRISLSPLRAVALGPRSMNAIDDALKADSSNPTAYLEKANALFYAPAMFGGSKKEAINHYRKALQLMQQQMLPEHRWLYLSTLVALATAYQDTGELQLAITTLRKAMETEPRFEWVKNELLPQMLQQQ